MKPNEKQCSICGAKGVTEMDVHGPCGFVEPGADTGTTPPIEELISKWSNELVYSLDEAEIDLIEKIAPLILRDMAAAERGPTPPEGLAFTFEEFIDMSLRHNKRLAAGISGIASFGHWYNEMLAATQRAPVEQGQVVEIMEKFREYRLWHEDQISYLAKKWRAKTYKHDGVTLTYDEDFLYGRETCADDLESMFKQENQATAPDHAREGALPSRGKLLAEASYWHNCAETKPSSFENATQWDILHYCAGIVERALADGKEGGE